MDIVVARSGWGPIETSGRLVQHDPKTVKRVIERRRAGEPFDGPRREPSKNTGAEAAVIAERVRATDGRISAKGLVPLARTAGYAGSAGNFRRASPRRRRRGGAGDGLYRPWQPTPDRHVVVD